MFSNASLYLLLTFCLSSLFVRLYILLWQIKANDGTKLTLIKKADTRPEGEYRVGDVVAYQKRSHIRAHQERLGEITKSEYGVWDLRMEDDGSVIRYVSSGSLKLLRSKVSKKYTGK